MILKGISLNANNDVLFKNENATLSSRVTESEKSLSPLKSSALAISFAIVLILLVPEQFGVRSLLFTSKRPHLSKPHALALWQLGTSSCFLKERPSCAWASCFAGWRRLLHCLRAFIQLFWFSLLVLK